MSTITATRYTPRPVEGGQGWEVVDQDGHVVATVGSRAQARAAAKQLNESPQWTADPEPAEVVVPSVEEEAAREEADRQAAEVAAEHATVDNDNAAQAAMDAEQQDEGIREDVLPTPPATRTKAEKAQRVTLARVQVGDRLMTNLTTEGNGIVYAAPHRFSDGQVRTVAEVTTRKAGDGEMPGTLYTLVFEDGTCSEERYGTTSHYPAEAFEVTQAPASTEKPAPAKKASAKKDPAPQVATTPSRAGKLTKGSRLVLRDLGVVTVDQVSKTGEGKLEVAYTTADDQSGVREMWGSTNVRLAAS